MNKASITPWEWIIIALLIVRPSLDLFTTLTFAIGPMNINPAGALSLLLIATGLIWVILMNAHNRNHLFRQPIILVYAIWLLAMLPWAFLPMWMIEDHALVGLREWVRLLSYLPIVLLAASLILKNQKTLFVWTLALGFIVPAALGIYQIITQEGMIVRGVHRVSGTFVHPNPYAFYLVLMIGVSYAVWRLKMKSIIRLLWVFVSIGLLISTYSFTGAVMFAVLIFLCAIGENRALRIWALSAVILFGVIFSITPAGWQRIKEVSQIDQLDEIERTGKETSSLTWRLLNWRFLYREWQKRPVLGYGLATSEFVNPNYNIYEKTGHQPHNDYVRFLVETGAVGLCLFLIMLIGVGYCLRYAYLLAAGKYSQLLLWIAMSIYATWLVGSMADNVITATAYQYCLWFVLTGACMYGSHTNPHQATEAIE